MIRTDFRIGLFFTVSVLAVSPPAFAQGAAANQAAQPVQITPYQPLPPPDFSGFWQHGPIAVYESVPFKADPVQDLKGPLDPTYFGVSFEGDFRNPLLKPWAADVVKRYTEAAEAGKELPSPQEVCEPSGVPNIMTLPAPVQFLPGKKEIVMLYQRDHQVRHIYMNVKHSAHLTPSWYGESVGHYDGDTLVVDTIGMNAKTPVDIFGTPHTEALHVVERMRLINNGRQMEVVFTVSDPNTFTSDWTARMVYNHANNVGIIEEEVCAENDRLPIGAYDIPTETKTIF